MSLVLDSSATLAWYFEDERSEAVTALLDRVAEECEAQSWAATIKLAELNELTVYDAAYLETAQRRRLPLATLDAALAVAAERAGVILVLPRKAG